MGLTYRQQLKIALELSSEDNKDAKAVPPPEDRAQSPALSDNHADNGRANPRGNKKTRTSMAGQSSSQTANTRAARTQKKCIGARATTANGKVAKANGLKRKPASGGGTKETKAKRQKRVNIAVDEVPSTESPPEPVASSVEAIGPMDDESNAPTATDAFDANWASKERLSSLPPHAPAASSDNNVASRDAEGNTLDSVDAVDADQTSAEHLSPPRALVILPISLPPSLMKDTSGTADDSLSAEPTTERPSLPTTDTSSQAQALSTSIDAVARAEISSIVMNDDAHVLRESSPVSSLTDFEEADATDGSNPMGDDGSGEAHGSPKKVQLLTPATSDTGAQPDAVRTPSARASSRKKRAPKKFQGIVDLSSSEIEHGTTLVDDTDVQHATADPQKSFKRRAGSSSKKRARDAEVQSGYESEIEVKAPRKKRAVQGQPIRGSKTPKTTRDPANPAGSVKRGKKTTSPKTPSKQPRPKKASPVTPPVRNKRKTSQLETPQTSEPVEMLPTPESSQDADCALPTVHIDPEKLALSRRMTLRQPLELKSLPQGEPVAWADSRQALCETLPYFKRPQGGCYQNEGHVYGFLFDSVGHCREYLDENAIICRAGGAMESDPAGGMVQKKDQLMKEAQPQAILNDIEHRNPVIVICGNRNVGAPCKMPHQYCVLGYYKPVAVWSEKTAGKGRRVWTTIKYRLERFCQAETAWHAPKDSDLTALESSAEPPMRKPCESCGVEYAQVYLQGWMCLNQECASFWKIGGVDAPYGKEGLDYNPDFLLQRAPQWGDESQLPGSLRPPVPDVGHVIGDNLTRINTRGICCPQCGRCNPRRLFTGWVCENPGCDYKLFPQHRPVTPALLREHTPWDAAPTQLRNHFERGQGVKIDVKHIHGYKVAKYTFEGIDGCFIHAAATRQVTREPRGPDDMFAAIQTEDMGLERRTFAVKKMSGGKTEKESTNEAIETADADAAPLPTPPTEEAAPLDQPRDEEDDADAPKKHDFEDGDLMTAFSMNYGMPYKFVASGASRPFTAAPWPVTACRARLNWAQRAFLSSSDSSPTATSAYQDFNEQLIFAYMSGQKIEYHDDGEAGLGPRIATLSLGGRAKMHLRMKLKHHAGCSKTGILTEERPVPGGLEGAERYAARLRAWNELQPLRHSDSAAYTRRRREIPRELGLLASRTKKAADLVTVSLAHGDIVIMDGYDVQRYLEHKVVPEACLRFALTCRAVLEDHLLPHERPAYEVGEAAEVYEGP